MSIVGCEDKNKFEKSVHLVSLITRIYHEAQSPERQILHGAANSCYVTKTQNIVCLETNKKGSKHAQNVTQCTVFFDR